MGQLVLGAAGAIVGGYLGGPAGASLGWSIGSAAGGALFPAKGPPGPRLTDLKTQVSQYGSMIPIAYATVPLSGNVIWQEEEFTEHENDGGGKGGPAEGSTFTYTISFAVLLCEGPIVDVLKIWAYGELIYDREAVAAQSEVVLLDPLRFGPDDWNYHVRHPETWERVETSDFVNQQRQAFGPGGINYDPGWSDAGYAGYFVNNTDPGLAGDMPELPFTVYYGDEDQGADPTMEAVLGVGNVPGYRGRAYIVFNQLDITKWGSIPQLTFLVATNKSGDIPVRYNTFTPPTVDDEPAFVAGVEFGTTIKIGRYIRGSPVSTYQTDFFTSAGDLITSTSAEVTNLPGDFNQEWILCSNDYRLAWAYRVQPGGPIQTGWYLDGVGVTPVVASAVPAMGNFYSVSASGSDSTLFRYEDYLYACGGHHTVATWVARYPITDDIPAAAADAYYQFPDNVVGTAVTVSDNGTVYVRGDAGATFQLYAFDADLNLLGAWDNLPSSWGDAYGFTVFNNKLLWTGADSILDGGDGQSNAICYEFNGYGVALTRVGAIPAYNGNVVSLGHGYAICGDGIISLIQPTGPMLLKDIVADVSERCGLSYYDVDELTDLVDGYVIGGQMTGRSMVEPLRSVYFFDAVESDDFVKFVKRDQPTLLIIPDDDLAAHNEGEDTPDLLPSLRGQDVDLPATVNVVYLNAAMDYQNGTQIAKRMATNSREALTLEMAIVISDAKAKQVADALLFNAHLERTSFSFSTTHKYAQYEPCDVIETHGKKLRLIKKVEQQGLIQWSAAPMLGEVFQQDALTLDGEGGSAPAGGFTPPTLPVPVRTSLQFLDIPILPGATDTFGAYAVMGGSTPDPWPGATLYKSLDGGLTYTAIGTDVTADTWGSTLGVLPDFLGGNIFDEISYVDVFMISGELASATELSVLNGANALSIGKEMLQFKNAELIAPKTYRLTGLLRGRLGTEWAISTHAVSENVVLITLGLTFFTSSLSDLNVARKYKAVTFGQTLASTTAVEFTNTGVSLRPYSLVQLGGGNDGTDVTLTGVRRTRINGEWVDGTDVPLGETSEAYVIQVWDASYSQVARRFMVSVPTVVYTSAMQVTDFGADQETVFFTINQIGVLLGRVSRGTAAGTGSTNDLPITPIAPYGFVSPPPVGVVNMTLTWPNDTDYTTGFTVGSTYVVEFTTGATAGGYIVLAEYGDPPTYRTAVLSTDAAGMNVLASNSSNTVTIFFSGLSPFTTYYFVVKNEYADGSPSGPVGSSANAVVQLHGV